MQEILDKIKVASARSLSRLIASALQAAQEQIEAQSSAYVAAKVPPVTAEAPAILQRFKQNLYSHFDYLTSARSDSDDFLTEEDEGISLLDHDYIEAMIAMEGMIRQLNEQEIPGAHDFRTRLEHLYPNLHIDQNNNPLDPEQIGDCFNRAIRPLGLKAHFLLTIYREFNKHVFSNLSEVFHDINRLLSVSGVLPRVGGSDDQESQPGSINGVEASSPASISPASISAAVDTQDTQEIAEGSSTTDASETQVDVEVNIGIDTDVDSKTTTDNQPEAARIDRIKSIETFTEQRQLLAQLLATGKTEALPFSPQSAQPSDTRNDGVYTELQRGIAQLQYDSSGSIEDSVTQIKQAVTVLLKQDSLSNIDQLSHDSLNLYFLFFDSLLSQPVLSDALRRLLLTTLLPLCRCALADADFFNLENHPGRALINEISRLGIVFTDHEQLASNPDYCRLRDCLAKITELETSDQSNLQTLFDELHSLKLHTEATGKNRVPDFALEKRIKESPPQLANSADITAYVSHQLESRVVEKDIDPAIRNLLNTHLQKALEKILSNEGVGGKSWKPVMHTIEVMLWSVQLEKQPGDKERFLRIRERLRTNLEQAMAFSAVSKTKIRKALGQLKQVQDYTFLKAESEQALAKDDALIKLSAQEPAPLDPEDPYLRRVSRYSPGSWFEFPGANGEPVRVFLAVRIDSIEKFIFTDRLGRKALELSKNRLANGLKSGLVTFLGDGAITSKAMAQLTRQLKKSQ